MNIKTIIGAAATIIALASCNEATNEYHSTSFYPLGNSKTLYADQTTDSIRVLSYDSWTLTNTDTWYDVTENSSQTNNISVTIPAGYAYSTRLDIHTQPNTTGAQRTGTLTVVSSYDKIGTVAMPLVQYPYLNISYPAAYYATTTATTPTFSLNLTQKDSNTEATSSITFTVYASDATLTSNADWLTPETTTGFTASVKQKVNITAKPNTTGTARVATLTLTSNGVSTNITVNQPAAK